MVYLAMYRLTRKLSSVDDGSVGDDLSAFGSQRTPRWALFFAAVCHLRVGKKKVSLESASLGVLYIAMYWTMYGQQSP